MDLAVRRSQSLIVSRVSVDVKQHYCFVEEEEEEEEEKEEKKRKKKRRRRRRRRKGRGGGGGEETGPGSFQLERCTPCTRLSLP